MFGTRKEKGKIKKTLYTVGAVKHIPGYRTYAAVDGGMGDNPRYALYKSSYMVLAAREDGSGDMK